MVDLSKIPAECWPAIQALMMWASVPIAAGYLFLLRLASKLRKDHLDDMRAWIDAQKAIRRRGRGSS